MLAFLIDELGNTNTRQCLSDTEEEEGSELPPDTVVIAAS